MMESTTIIVADINEEEYFEKNEKNAMDDKLSEFFIESAAARDDATKRN